MTLLGIIAGLPFLAVRAVTDPADLTLPGWLAGEIDEAGGLGYSRLVVRLCGTPRDWSRVIRLARGLRAAQGTLAGAWRYGGTGLGVPAPACTS